MKLRTWTASIAALVFSAAPVFAVEGNVQWSNDGMLQPASCDTGCCDPCDCGDACHCGSGVCGGGLLSGYGNGAVEGFSLAGALGLSACSPWQVGGWTQFGYHDSFTPLSSPATGRGTGLAFNDVPKDLNLQQQWFYIGREADGSNGLDLGFRMDTIYGTDAQKTQSFGNPGSQFDNDWDHGVYGWAIPQLYGEIAINDLSVKVGHFFTIVGYEVVPATGNFFYSHSYTMFNSEPFTHTGVLGTYNGFEDMTLYGGWTLGWDTGFTNANGGNNYIGGFGFDLMDDVNLTMISTYGNFGLKDGGGEDSYSHSVVMTADLTDKVSYVFQTDYLDTDDNNDAGQPGIDNIGINQYLFYNWSDAIAFGTRIEWWKGSAPQDFIPPSPFNTRSSRYELTGGVNVKLLDNLVMRPEVRKDWCPAEDFDQDMAACDFILTY